MVGCTLNIKVSRLKLVAAKLFHARFLELL